MLVTLKDIQDYWRNYCERHGLNDDVVTEGLRQITLNQDYWADHTMRELEDVAMKKLNRR